MKLIPYDIEKITKATKGNNRVLLEEFIQSDMTCAKVEGYPHKNAKVAYSCLRTSIKRFHMAVDAILKKGEVFLVKKR